MTGLTAYLVVITALLKVHSIYTRVEKRENT